MTRHAFPVLLSVVTGKGGPFMTELENMLSGRLYLAEDESLTAARLRA